MTSLDGDSASSVPPSAPGAPREPRRPVPTAPAPTAPSRANAVPARPGRQARRDLALATLLAILTALVFAPALENGFTLWDDDLYVTENSLLGDLSAGGIARLFTTRVDANYLPLTLLSFSIEHALVGLEPWLYHLTNIVLHALAAALVYLLGRRWLASPAAALLAAALFALHPLRAESVAWVTERKDLLCAVFYLATLLAYEHAETRASTRWRIASFALFLAALLSKVMAISLPAVLVVYHLARRDLDRRRLLRLAPYLVLGIAFTILGVATQAADDAVKGLHGGSVLAHLGTVVRAIGFYASKLLAPVRLSPLYIFEPPGSLLDPMFLAGAALALAALVASIASWRGERRAFFWIGFFAVTWLPVSGIVPSGMPVADRYLYLPGLGLGWLLAETLVRDLESQVAWSRGVARAGLLVVVAHLVVSVPLTAQQTRAWKSHETLWATALGEDPENRVAHHQIAHAHLRAGRYAEALEHGSRAFELGYVHPRQGTAIACAFRGLGDFARERDTIRAILAAQPDWTPARVAFARHLIEDGRLEEAQRLVEAIEAETAVPSGTPSPGPDLRTLRARLTLAEAEAAVRDGKSREHEKATRDALASLRRVLERFPGDAESRVLLARAHRLLGEPERALDAIERVLASAGHPPYADVRRDLATTLVALESEPSVAERTRELERAVLRRGWASR